MVEEKKEKQYKKRLAFKTEIKDKWLYTAWYYCDRFEIPYGLEHFLKTLLENLASENLHFKIETIKR